MKDIKTLIGQCISEVMDENLQEELYIKECIKKILMEELSEAWPERYPTDPIRKTTSEIMAKLKAAGMPVSGNYPDENMEYYLNGFATVGCWSGDGKVHLERYYDSETLDSMPGHHISVAYPIPDPYDPTFVDKIATACTRMVKGIRGDEAIFGDVEQNLRDLGNPQLEGFDPQSMGGPNPEATEGNSVENPYEAWNSKMRKMEEGHDFNSVEDDNPATTPEAQNFPYASQNATMRKMEENEEEKPLYVTYDSPRQGEEPFMFQGSQWVYCNGIYPGGKKDIAVYSYGQDMAVAYDVFQNYLGKGEGVKEIK